MNAHELGYSIGFMVAFVVVLLLSYIFRKKIKLHEYDERQILARGKAYKYGMFTSFICIGILNIFATVGIQWFMSMTGLMTVIVVSVTVFAVVSIWNDAYLSLKEKKSNVIIGFLLIAVINLIGSFDVIVKGDFLDESGRLVAGVTNLELVIMLIIISIAIVIKATVDKKRSEEDDDEED